MGWGGVNQASGGVFYLARFLSQDFNCFYATTVKMIIAVCVFVLYETSFHKFEIHLGIGPDQPHLPQPLRCLAKLASPVPLPLPLRSSLSNVSFYCLVFPIIYYSTCGSCYYRGFFGYNSEPFSWNCSLSDNDGDEVSL